MDLAGLRLQWRSGRNRYFPTQETIPVEWTLAFLLGGTVLGSFLNVCICRLPAGRSIVAPRSCCPACGTPICWYDLFPLISYIALRRRCRACTGVISPVYPLVEGLTGISWALAYQYWGLSGELAVGLVLVSVLIGVSVTDIQTGLIPDLYSVFLGLVGLGLALSGGLQVLAESLAGAAMGAGLLYGVGLIGTWVLRRQSMGLGDLKLVGALGLFLGLEGVLNMLLWACALGAATGLGLRLTGRLQPFQAVPFAPFLSIATVLDLLGVELLGLLVH